ncbi:MAG: FAD-dependent oxidoreductase [Bacteroidetes bacterium]|nr:FAD-dependent oxidoreductase [Bacteroidota bacterium]
MSEPPDIHPVAVIGGGVAGIAAAVGLVSRGIPPILLESRPYLGGRVRSFVHERTGDEIDNGQHLLMGCYHGTFRLLETIGTRNLIRLQPTLSVEFRDADGRRSLLHAPNAVPSPLDVLIGMLRLQTLSLRERAALVRIGLALMVRTPRAEETVQEYLVRHGQSTNTQQRIWDPIAIATLNTPTRDASALLFANVMRLAFLGRGDDSHLAFPRAGLSRLLEPANAYVAAHGGSIRLGTTVTSITEHVEGSQTRYEIGVKDGPPIVARTIIAALPERALRPLLPAGSPPVSRLPADGAMGYAPIVSLYLWYDRPLTNLPEFAALIGTNVQWMFNRRRIDGSQNDMFPGLLSCTISAAFEESATAIELIVATADRELRGAFPEMAGARLMESQVIKEKQATFAATPAAQRAREGTSMHHGGFVLAGDWTTTDLPATIEGAVRSGWRAAMAIQS